MLEDARLEVDSSLNARHVIECRCGLSGLRLKLCNCVASAMERSPAGNPKTDTKLLRVRL